jgi:hypothetical protein
LNIVGAPTTRSSLVLASHRFRRARESRHTRASMRLTFRRSRTRRSSSQKSCDSPAIASVFAIEREHSRLYFRPSVGGA